MLSVSPTAGAGLDLAAVDVVLEFAPLLHGCLAVFALRPGLSALVQMCLVVPDDVLVEDGDVAAGCLDVEVPEQCGADVMGGPLLTSSVAKILRKSCGGEFQPAEPGAARPAPRSVPVAVPRCSSSSIALTITAIDEGSWCR